MPAELGALIAHARNRPPLAGPVVIWGAGGKGARVARFLAAQGIEVLGVLDRRAQPGQRCEGLPVHEPRALPAGAATLVVAIHNPSVDLADVAREAAALGYRRVVLPVELHQICGDALAQDYFLAPASAYEGKEAEIFRARALLADEASRAWFDRALEFRLGGDPARLAPPSPSDQYRPADLPRWDEPMRLADCGAYDGDSLRHLREAGYWIDAYAGFEADPETFGRLCGEAGLPPGARLFQAAVAGASGRLRFAAGRGGASRADAEGTLEVPAVRLDDVLADFAPTLIKMDVEGAEHDALQGAAGLVARHRPGLAISAYHRPEDLWRLALQIDAWSLGYRLYLRGHAHSTFDLVLYGRPA